MFYKIYLFKSKKIFKYKKKLRFNQINTKDKFLNFLKNSTNDLQEIAENQAFEN